MTAKEKSHMRLHFELLLNNYREMFDLSFMYEL